MACEQVELASVPFVSFVANKNANNADRQLLLRAARLCAPLARQVWGEYDRVKLNDLVAPKGGTNVRQAAG